ncbi:uncharacterized protein BX664DRAFT_146794 [Halteromyces radiatus]|uniref:uncharacterized protein n=1 Tax=Halteromyces radiatus TaxID=101107 RepID=UPI0022206B57|nr:uncharacterized protein BX664DRAFT_146794 [Halteromyces radiatus]KAI8090003.1 hypothetical protein BX664DRAFT_146794 [Halteromyces radiatus]
MPPPANSTLGERVSQLIQSLQFSWFVGHVLTLIGTFVYALSYITFRANVKPYKIAYLGALVSYGVVIYKTHGIPRINSAYVQRMVVDENVQYFLLALYWFFSSPVEVTLIPFATFSTFHSLGYIRTNIIPTVFPVPRQASGSNTPATWQAKTQQAIKSWTDKNYGYAMRFVATAEVTIIMPRLVLGLFRLRLVPVFLYAQFLRFRFHLSSYTRQAFAELRTNMDRALLPPTASAHIPPMVSQLYTTAKAMVIKYGESAVQRQPAPGQQ